MDSELKEILAVLLRLSPERITQVRDLLVSLEEMSGAPAEFMAELATFERLRPDLRKRYPGRAVAIYKGEVVADGTDKMHVLDEVLARHGPVICYIDNVDPPAPRRVPSVWSAR
jgi:hypothetical protein